jgi:tRNA nucleotidyltransferase/poly(A) polymerase
MLIQEVEDDAPASQTLTLTPVEQTLTRLLLDVSNYMDDNPTSPQTASHVELPAELANQKLVLRYTGGWVRDKLLGVPSHDIDVAINKMTGFQFGLRMKQYLEIPGNLEKYGLESLAANDKQNLKAGTTDKSKTVGGLHKIEANPEKSKHLETTTMRILGLDIDLVNLRKETYSDDSRNPEMEFGTPEEDALRRDATVNAMFYNLNTKETEDFTGRGHQDMARMVISTPLEPYQTFKDDPLRVLRLIRFASRLGYTIEPEVLEAARNPDIKEALRRKISRERVGVELEKALSGPDPHEALRLVFDLDLYETIFSDPAVANVDHYSPDTDGWQVVIDALNDMLSSEGIIATNFARDREEQYFAWQLAAMVPYRDTPHPVSSDPNRKPPPPVAVTVVKEGIKATNRVSDVIHASIRNEPEISDLVNKLYDRKRRPDKKFEGEDATARDVLGMAVRRWGATWRSQVVYSMLVEIANSQDQVEGKPPLKVLHMSSTNTQFQPLSANTPHSSSTSPPSPFSTLPPSNLS